RLSLIGPDIDILQEFSTRIEERLIDDPNIMSVDNARTRPQPELQFTPDRLRINKIGATTNEVASSYGTQARGTRAGFFIDEGREIPIQVRNKRENFQNRQDLFSLELLQYEEQRVPIVALGSFNFDEGVSRISRRDREVVLDISISVRGPIEEYREQIQTILTNDIILPDGYRYDFTGSLRDFDMGMGQLSMAFLFALILTYMVMASLFENFRDPFIIMFTVPLAFFGSLLFLFVTNTSLSVPAYIGIVLLVGIVVNNGIVLVDYIHFYTKKSGVTGKAYVIAFLQACKRRMRPIILTAMTTIFSMVPLALEIGAGAETWSPLARSVIGGLTFATILTLFVVPAIVVGISKERREWVKEGLDDV
ncbi:MAG: AcrB/AcrD/AcrF family protein, partial [Bacteroidetes bacterium]|nr:AcrB/AcrD/AcrF family protein [Bacteroidota bacterium]